MRVQALRTQTGTTAAQAADAQAAREHLHAPGAFFRDAVSNLQGGNAAWFMPARRAPSLPYDARTAPTTLSSVAKDADPLTHLQYLASAELEGRDTPSAGLDKAAAYIRDILKKYNLKGPNPGDAQSPYFQTFQYDGGRTQNVAGLIEGTGPNKDEVIVLMAHYDHVGKYGTRVYPGATDNGSGSSALLAVIPELVAAKARGQLDRSVMLLWTTGEEQGLVGSSYYVRSPFPGVGLDKIAGVINTDMVGRWDDERMSASHFNRDGKVNYFGALIDQANRELKDPFDRINRDVDIYRNRQDGWVFSREGEDVVFLFEGLSNPRGGGNITPVYHNVDDTFENLMAENQGLKLQKVTQLLGRLTQLAANRTRPDNLAEDTRRYWAQPVATL